MAKTQGHGNPKWSREEIILALDLYFKLDGKVPDDSDERIGDLSTYLRNMPNHLNAAKKESFRNRSGVTFKLQNLRQIATGKGLGNVSDMDRQVWKELGSSPLKTAELAETIRKSVAIYKELDEAEDYELEFREGAVVTRLHKTRERSTSLRKQLIKDRLKKGPLACEACGLSPVFSNEILGDALFEAHHIVPISSTSERKTKISDMALVCANCHRLLHRAIALEKRWLSIDEAKNYIRQKNS